MTLPIGHWAVSLASTSIKIERWRRECNEERPERCAGGRPLLAYAWQIPNKNLTLCPDTLVAP